MHRTAASGRPALTELVTGYGMTETSAGLTFTEPSGPLELLEATVGRIIDGGAAGMPELGGRVAVCKTCDPNGGKENVRVGKNDRRTHLLTPALAPKIRLG